MEGSFLQVSIERELTIFDHVREVVNDHFNLDFCCSCSQQEAYEEPEQPNGLYALHLLRHIHRNERIELILMDVARGE